MIRVSMFKYVFPIKIKIKIRILDLMFLPKNSVPFERIYYSSEVIQTEHQCCEKKIIHCFDEFTRQLHWNQRMSDGF